MRTQTMSDRVCETCGATTDASAQFCPSCDAYLGWDRGQATLNGDPLVGTVPPVIDAVLTETALHPVVGGVDGVDGADGVDSATDAGAEPDADTGTPASGIQPPDEPPQPRTVLPPDVVVKTAEVDLVPGTAAGVELSVTNESAVVEGYTLTALDAPPWLAITHDDAHLMPSEGRIVTLTLEPRPDVLVFVQRFILHVEVRSGVDASQVTTVAVAVTVPPHGRRLAIEARPSLIRLEDASAGTFSVLLDNRAANYPETVGLSGSDPEAVVRFAFTPEVVTVPPGQIVEAAVSFTAPPPDAGRELTRQLSIVALNDEGPITASVMLAQHTSAPIVEAPLQAQLQPSRMHLVNATDIDFDVVIDNRAGSTARVVTVSGRDPEHVLQFAFLPTSVDAVPGEVTVVRGRVRAPRPPNGRVVAHPFTVVVSDGVHDAEAAGVVDSEATPDPITTATLRVEPQRYTAVNSREGVYRLEIDNRLGTEPLRVHLTGSADDGTARFVFTPADVSVEAGGTGLVPFHVDCPRPQPKQSVTRQLTIEATDGRNSIEATASFLQASSDRRPVASRWLTILGAIIVIIGALTTWFEGFDPALPSIGLIQELIASPPGEVGLGLVEVGVRVLVLILAVMMALGLTGRSGRLIRFSAVLILILSLGFLGFVAVVASLPGLGFGLVLVWTGAVLGFIGGVLARPRT